MRLISFTLPLPSFFSSKDPSLALLNVEEECHLTDLDLYRQTAGFVLG